MDGGFFLPSSLRFPVLCQSWFPRGAGAGGCDVEPVKRQERSAGSGSRGPTASKALEIALKVRTEKSQMVMIEAN